MVLASGWSVVTAIGFCTLLSAATVEALGGGLQLAITPNCREVGENLIPNSSFEEAIDGLPQGWNWSPRNTDATGVLLPGGRQGGHCLYCTNSTPTAPHVYGQFLLDGGLRLVPGQAYTLSFYARSESPGPAWVGGGEGWWVRCGLRATGTTWQRFALTFVARDGDAHFPLMINTDGPTPGFAVDDLKLEAGAVATPFVGQGAMNRPVELLVDVPVVLGGPAERVDLAFLLHAAVALPGARIAARMVGGGALPLAEASRRVDLPVGLHGVALSWDVAALTRQRVTLELTVSAPGQEERRETAAFELLTTAAFRDAEAALARAAAVLSTRLQAALAQGLAARPERAAQAVLDRFTPIARQKWEVGRPAAAFRDLDFLTELARDRDAALQAALVDTARDLVVPEPDLSHLTIAQGSFRVAGEPVMVVGPMGYDELEKELSRQADFGFNTVGDDYDNGGSCIRMMTAPGVSDPEAVPRLRRSWERLRGLNLAVSFNPTLHYFPEWALKRAPDISGGDPVDCLPDWSGLGGHAGKRTKSYGGFFPFAIDSPSLRERVREYYAALFPGLRDQAGTHLVWLMNEPTYASRDAHYLELYRQFLLTRFGTLERLNAAWGSAYADLAAVTRPELRDSPEQFDWLTFHQDQVASWFEWLAAEARRQAPGLLLSNKPMAWTLLHPDLGIDWEREALLWDVPGCDAGRSPGAAMYAFGWRDATFCFDFQKSVAPGKPLGDFEYHYVHEPEVSAEYVRATYWHSYLHGLRWSNFWVWATGELGTAAAGAGMTDTAWSQPRVAWGTATAALDLRRLARYVAAFPGHPQVRLYFGRASLYRDSSVYPGTLTAAYEAANGLDAPVGFITDRMIRAGELGAVRLLVVPAARYVEADVLESIQRYASAGGQVLLIGDSLSVDEYGRPHAAALSGLGAKVTVVPGGSAEVLVPPLASALTAASVDRPVRAWREDGRPAWPLECRSARVDGRLIVYLLGLGKDPVDITLAAEPPVQRWTDLIRATPGTGNRFTLRPLEVRLLAIE